MTEDRPEGFYWVRWSERGCWDVAMWEDGQWWLPGADMSFSGASFDRIGPRLTPPED